LRFDEIQLPPELLGYIQGKGLTELYPPQEEAIRSGLLEGKSLVVSSPTASGKTLIAIMAAFVKTKLQGRKAVYLAPLRALASEKYAEFSELARFGIKTVISTGDYDSSGESLGRGDIIVLTNERFDSVMRHRVSWLGSVGLFIADEVHLAGNDSRGPTLEMILTKIMHLGLDVQMLSLSATISNSSTIGDWLRSRVVKVDWRPVPLREAVYDYGRIVFTDGEARPIPRSTYGAPIDVAVDVLKAGGQALIFANTRRRAVSLATKAAELTQRYLSEQEKKAVSEAARRILTSGEETSLSSLLAETVAKGSAFHHAGLDTEHRHIVEEYYRARAIKILAATPTLCLPAGEEIFCNARPERIERLDSSFKVLTHLNRFRDVIAPIKRPYSGTLREISTHGQLPMKMTPEHRVLRVQRKRHSIHSNTRNVHWWTYSTPEWVQAREIAVGDLVLFPRLKEERDLRAINLPTAGPLRNQTGVVGVHWSRLKLEEIALDELALEFLGLYVAEGYSQRNGAVYFAINQREDLLTGTITSWFSHAGLRWRIENRSRHRRIVYACSKQLASKMRELFGTNAPDKRIPDELFLLPSYKLIPLIRGIWRGDGSLDLRRGEEVARYSTTSRVLAKQLFALLVKLGFMPSMTKSREADRSGRLSMESDIVHKHDLYEIRISGKQLKEFCHLVLKEGIPASGNREYNFNHIDENYYYMLVKGIREDKFKGYVYNLEVQGDSSYVGAFVVHNSAGVNIPARRVVVADMTRYDAERGGNAEISVLEYRQMAGRAGRPQYDDYGETVIIPPPSQPSATVLEHYAKDPPEPIESMLSEEGAMRFHTLAAVATGTGLSRRDVDSLFGGTLLAIQAGAEKVEKLTDGALGYLHAERLVETRGSLFYATDFGRRVSMLYIDPATGVLFREALKRGEPGRSYTAGLLHLVARTPDFAPKFPLRSKDYDTAIAFMEEHGSELLERPTPRSFSDYDETLQEMRTVMALYGWIDEWREEQLLSRLGVEPGDMHRAVDNAEWLLHSLEELAKLFKRPEMVRQAELLRLRVEAGVSEELVELTTLEGVGRARSRALYTAGFRTLEDIKEASAEKLAAVDKVGTTVARRIKEQVARL
jgi:helicase